MQVEPQPEASGFVSLWRSVGIEPEPTGTLRSADGWKIQYKIHWCLWGTLFIKDVVGIVQSIQAEGPGVTLPGVSDPPTVLPKYNLALLAWTQIQRGRSLKAKG